MKFWLITLTSPWGHLVVNAAVVRAKSADDAYKIILETDWGLRDAVMNREEYRIDELSEDGIPEVILADYPN